MSEKKFKLTSLHEKDLLAIENYIFTIQIGKIYYKKKASDAYKKTDDAQQKRISQLIKNGYVGVTNTPTKQMRGNVLIVNDYA